MTAANPAAGAASGPAPPALPHEPPIYCLQPPRAVPAEVQARLHAPAPWNAFYALHATGFFKDRHWLSREFPELDGAARVAEIGCGVGNAARPLARGGPPGRLVFASDFSETAIDMLRAAPEVADGRLIAYVADAGVAGTLARPADAPPSDARPRPASLDAATLIFALSAMAPPQQATAVANVAALLRAGGLALVRDYADGDAAAARLAARAAPRELDPTAPGGEGGGDADADAEDAAAPPPLTGGRFLARGDGTLAYFFPPSELRALFERAGFATRRCGVVDLVKTNRRTGQVMARAWVQGVFEWGGGGGEGGGQEAGAPRSDLDAAPPRYVGEWEAGDGDDGDDALAPLFAPADGAAAVDMETAAVRLPSPPGALAVRRAAGELRSTLAHTGLLAWPAAPALARALCSPRAAALLAGASVLEVGAGGSPLVALAATARGARRVVATDGSPVAARLLSDNVAANAASVVAERVRVAALEWGDAAAARGLAAAHTPGGRGFSLVLGADVLYSPAAVARLMTTLAAALADGGVCVLCHQTRRVTDDDAVAAARGAGLAARPPPGGLAAAAAEHGVGEGRLLRLLCFEKAGGGVDGAREKHTGV